MKDINNFPRHLKGLKRGVDKLSNIVKSTLGPSGSPVILEMKDGEFIITKDGVTVAKEIDLADPIENMGAQLIKQVASNVAKESGDGCMSLDCKIRTPSGTVRFGDLKIGDVILGTNNSNQEVTGIFPAGIKRVYNLVFHDGREVECCEDHLWKVTIINLLDYTNTDKVLKLKDIRANLEGNIYIFPDELEANKSKRIQLFDIEETDKEVEMMCIKVSNKDSLYVMDNYIVTHNTTSSVVLAQAIFNGGIKNVASGANPLDLKRGMDKAVLEVVKDLREQTRLVTSSNEVAQVGSISANNDMEIGQMIADAMDKVGKDGVITVEEARGTETYVSVTEGMEFNQGFLSRYFINKKDTSTVEYENARILFCKDKLDSMDKLIPIVEKCITANVPLVIIAQEVEGSCLNTLILNKTRGDRKLCAVRAPYFSDRRDDALEDMAVLTGGIVVDSDKGMRLDSLELDDLGQCEKIVITQDRTLIIGGFGDEGLIEERAQEIEAKIESSYSDYDREKYQERLAKLSGGVAIIYVGATTEVELKEKKDRIDDALHATRAAVQEGIIPGGGVGLLNAYFNISNKIQSKEIEVNLRELEGFNIVLNAITVPFKTILANAGIDYQIPIQTLEQLSNKDFGYNVHTGEVVNMIESGIIDPTKVSRLALENAASIAGLLLISKGTVSYTRFNVPNSKSNSSNDYLTLDDLD